MTSRRIFALLFLILGATVVQAQIPPFDIEAGYRFLDLNGNRGMYRTQINEQEGFLIRSFSLTSTDIGDRFRVTATDFGTSPAGAIRIEADRRNLYRFTLGYRTADQYSIFLNQHFTNRTRRTLDAELELFPEQRIAPYIGYSFNRFAGPGETTYHFGQDEFLLQQKLKDVDQEVRAGASFKFDKTYGSFTQGWRRFRGSSDFSLFPGAGGGNEPGTILGQPVNATTITRHDLVKVSTPFTNLYVTTELVPHVRLTGNYVRFAADQKGNEQESAFGSFASFAISRFFTGYDEHGGSRAKNTTWRGGARAEVAIADGADVFAGFQREHRELDGDAIVDMIYLQSITFGGVDQRDFTVLLDAHSSIDRNEDTLNAGISARKLGPFAIRAEVRQSKLDVDVAPDAAEIVVPGSQGGSYERRVNTFDTNASYTQGAFSVGAAWRRDRGNRPIFRTDFEDRDRYRLRARWTAPKWVALGATAERTTLSNGETLDARIRQYTADIGVTPIQALTLRASASQFKSDSSITYRRPETFALATSIHVENGRAREGGFTLTLPRVTLDAGLTRFRNQGSLPFTLNRLRSRATFPLKGRYGLALEFDKDKYDESSTLDFDASRYGIFLRIQ